MSMRLELSQIYRQSLITKYQGEAVSILQTCSVPEAVLSLTTIIWGVLWGHQKIQNWWDPEVQLLISKVETFRHSKNHRKIYHPDYVDVINDQGIVPLSLKLQFYNCLKKCRKKNPKFDLINNYLIC